MEEESKEREEVSPSVAALGRRGGWGCSIATRSDLAGELEVSMAGWSEPVEERRSWLPVEERRSWLSGFSQRRGFSGEPRLSRHH